MAPGFVGYPGEILILNLTGHHGQFYSRGPAQAFPEFNAALVSFINKKMTFLDSDPGQSKHTAADQGLSYPLPAVPRMNHQVVDITPPTIMSAEHTAHNLSILPG